MKKELQLRPMPVLRRPDATGGPMRWWREVLQDQPALTWFAIAMWAAMLPTLIAWGLDERTLREASIWAKPLKFMASVGLFALTSAWFVGLLAPDRRRTPVVQAVVAVIIATGLFEVGYITLQAALGQASHYNETSALHQVMYTLMGLGALLLTATQPVLAWQITRHSRPGLHPVWKEAVVVGLAATFVLGAGVGALLGGMQPPAGAGLPVVGWHLSGGDLRPAHFLGIHAQQLIPAAGALLAFRRMPYARTWLWCFVLGYTVLWGWAVLNGLDGNTPTPPAFFGALT